MNMTLYKYGASTLEKPINDVLQRWRISLASLLFFTIFLTDNFGLSTSELGSSSSKINYDDYNSFSRRRNYHDCITTTRSGCSNSVTQCLGSAKASANLTDSICHKGSTLDNTGGGGKDSRERLMRRKRLSFCSMFFVYNVIGPGCYVDVTSGKMHECDKCMTELECLDLEAQSNFRYFEKLISRFDCSRNYSTRANCTNCKEQYKNWLCTSFIKFYLIDEQKRVRDRLYPCMDFCEQVEGQCPYFLPEVDSQYAGEPSFLCKDRTVSHISHQKYPCYKPCALDRSLSQVGQTCIINADNLTNHVNSSSSAARASSATSTVLSKQYTCLVAQLTFVWLIRISLEYLCAGST